MQTTLIDPYEIAYAPPPARAPMMTISVDVDFEMDAAPPARGSQPDDARDSGSRVRCCCSED